MPATVLHGLRKPLLLVRPTEVGILHPYIEDIRQNDLSPAQYENWVRLCQGDPYNLIESYGGPDVIATEDLIPPALLFPGSHLL
ncbi:hypothetical protein ACWFMI_24720 [Nocardiopsis terrae]